jgi:hypothetical protein
MAAAPAEQLEIYANICGGDFVIESKIESNGWILCERQLKIHACNGKIYRFKIKAWHSLNISSSNAADKMSKMHVDFQAEPGVHMQWNWLMTRKKDNCTILHIIGPVKCRPSGSGSSSMIRSWTCGTINRSDLNNDIIVKVGIAVTDDDSLNDEPSWNKTIDNLYDKETRSDVKIICDKTTFNCHRVSTH